MKNKSPQKKSFIKTAFRFIKNLFPSISEIKKERGSFLGAIISGLLFILIFPKPSISFLAWAALIPFLFAIKNKSPKTSFWIGIVFGFIGSYGSLFWINHIRKYNFLAVLGIPFIAVYFSLYTGIFAAIYSKSERRLKRTNFLFAACIWTSLEYLRSIGTFGFPFNILAASQIKSITLIQICDITGPLGISFLIILANIFIANLIYYYKIKQYKNIPFEAAVVSGLLIFSFVYGSLRLKNDFTIHDRKIKIGIVQPSIPQEMKFKSYMSADADLRKKIQDEMTEKQLSLIRLKKSEGINLFILPESAFTDENFIMDKTLHEKLFALAKEMDADIFFGADRYVMLDKKAQITENAAECAGYGAYNSAWFLSKTTGLDFNSYDKIHLLPFGEYVPYFDKIPYFQELIVQVGSFMQGKKISIFESNNIKFSAGICIESVYGNLMRQFRKKGAEFLVIITNDAWYEDTAGPLQHADFSVFRAVENRCWLIRCGNHGISGFISPYGVWYPKSKIDEVCVLVSEINPAIIEKSFYVKYGDILSIIVLLISLSILLKIIFHSDSDNTIIRH